MILLLPLLLTTACVRLLARVLVPRGVDRAAHWDSWPAAAAAGMAMVYLNTAATHFIEPQRSGLIAIVPGFLPRPELLVTLTGIIELVLAVALLIPRTRRPAAWASVLLLLALFPANVVAAAGVDHPAAPSTPLLPRALLQLVLIGFSAAAALPRRRVSPPAAG